MSAGLVDRAVELLLSRRLVDWGVVLSEARSADERRVLACLAVVEAVAERHPQGSSVVLDVAERDELLRRLWPMRSAWAGDPLERAHPAPGVDATSDDRAGIYERALQRLSKGSRDVIVGRFGAGLGYEDLAHDVGLASPAAARMMVTWALRRWLSELDHCETDVE